MEIEIPPGEASVKLVGLTVCPAGWCLCVGFDDEPQSVTVNGRSVSISRSIASYCPVSEDYPLTSDMTLQVEWEDDVGRKGTGTLTLEGIFTPADPLPHLSSLLTPKTGRSMYISTF